MSNILGKSVSSIQRLSMGVDRGECRLSPQEGVQILPAWEGSQKTPPCFARCFRLRMRSRAASLLPIPVPLLPSLLCKGDRQDAFLCSWSSVPTLPTAARKEKHRGPGFGAYPEPPPLSAGHSGCVDQSVCFFVFFFSSAHREQKALRAGGGNHSSQMLL